MYIRGRFGNCDVSNKNTELKILCSDAPTIPSHRVVESRLIYEKLPRI
jgi:uncharacterized protein (UPF0248 family)